MKYLKPTPELIAEMGSRLHDDDRRCLDLPNGNPRAVRFWRRDNGRLEIIAPWLTADFFSLPTRQ